MAKLSDEVIVLPDDGTVLTLTRALVDNTSGAGSGGAHARRAEVTCFLSDAAFRIGENPDLDAYEYMPLNVGDIIEFEGLETLRDVKFVNTSSSVEGKLFVEYFDK